ncbi:uncharacterized protein MELLADRAFT_89212 [Melampsora larici-populina 98AG31]|uniref:Uncharacterized protein n=1 Tax=Melampsora larici-populina (strain 98AG31 / pathotype 3-4-7) TaxID=747676 RepID=F4R5C2_MELLP|nr:uncharacterized protein MELLADRAFT_89212 [Melampsora larici-populina 98AG31]EGG12288.1 hypothetical protein MELLADRAFT_89212 [Melampsora larici-populina 98AG31]
MLSSDCSSIAGPSPSTSWLMYSRTYSKSEQAIVNESNEKIRKDNSKSKGGAKLTDHHNHSHAKDSSSSDKFLLENGGKRKKKAIDHVEDDSSEEGKSAKRVKLVDDMKPAYSQLVADATASATAKVKQQVKSIKTCKTQESNTVDEAQCGDSKRSHKGWVWVEERPESNDLLPKDNQHVQSQVETSSRRTRSGRAIG